MDTLAATYISATSITAGAAASEAERRKTLKYEYLCNRYIFIPFGVETFGTWGPESASFVANLGRRLKDKTGEIRSVEFLRQRLSIEIQRGNAASVLGTVPRSKALDEIYECCSY